MIIYIKQLFENASLGDCWGIFSAVFSVVVVAWRFWIRYKNRHTKNRQNYLTEINNVYHLFQHGKDSKIAYDVNRQADAVRLIQNLQDSIFKMNGCYLDYPEEAVYDFFNAHQAFINDWYKALRPPEWEQWCDRTKSPLCPDRTLNWDAFDPSKFSGKYDSLSGKLKNLRSQVRNSIPSKELME